MRFDARFFEKSAPWNEVISAGVCNMLF